jgi:hypothetical protein
MKNLMIGLFGWAAVMALLLLTDSGIPQKTHNNFKQLRPHDAAEELRVLHERIVRDTILYF